MTKIMINCSIVLLGGFEDMLIRGQCSYRNAVRNANTPIGHNIAFLRNTLEINIDNNETTPDIGLPKVYLTHEQGVLLSNLKMLIAV